MSRRQCVVDALCHRESNPIPYTLYLTGTAKDQLIAYTKDPDIEHKLGSFLIGVPYNPLETELPDKPGYFKDHFGVIWNRSGPDKDIGVVINAQIEDLENHDYCFPKPDIKTMCAKLEHALRNREDKFVYLDIGFSVFERSWTLMGMENVLASMILCPDELEHLYDQICDYYMELLDAALDYDIDAVWFGDDWGQQKGMIMSPEHWRRFIKPRIKKLFKRIKEGNKFVMLHCCGDIRDIFPDLVEIGLDCFQTFQPEIYDIKEMKELYGDKITFWGGISVQRDLPFMTPEQVKELTIQTIRTLRKNGGLIIAPSHAITYDIPPENILAIAEVFMNQEKYLY